MHFSEHIKIREEKFGTVVFDTLREKVFVVNETGKDILNLLREGKLIEDIIGLLASAYNVQPEAIKEDVAGFIKQLEKDKIASL